MLDDNNDDPPDISTSPAPQLSPRRSSRTTSRHDYSAAAANARGFGLTALGAHIGMAPIPKSLSSAFRSLEREQWRKVVHSERDSLHSKQVFGPPVPLPPGKRALRLHYVLDRKYNKDGSVKKRKARAVVDGSQHVSGTDFTEVFAPCIRFTSLRVLLSLVAAFGLKTANFDCKTAYLNAGVEEEIYVAALPLFPDKAPDPAHVGKVCRLQRALYGLKQAGRQWYLKFRDTMKSLGFKQSDADPGIYIRIKNHEIETIVAVYVDDIICAGHGDSWIIPLYDELSQHFEITYDGEADWCLGMGIDYNDDGSVKIHQTKYIDDMLKNFNMEKANPQDTPMALSYKDDAESPPLSSNTPYTSLVGSLNYASVCTRPDISFAVSILCKHMINPTKNHWQAAKRVLRYLKGTKDYGITFDKNPACDKNILTA